MPIGIALRNVNGDGDPFVEVSGFDQRLVTDEMAEGFGIARATGYHDPMWGAIRTVLGRVPNTVWLNDPTSGLSNERDQFGGGAFDSNRHWRPCAVIKRPVSARIVEISAEPKALASIPFDNRFNSDIGHYEEELSWSITNYAEVTHGTHWSQAFSISLSAEYGGEAQGYKVGIEVTSTTEFGGSTDKTTGDSNTISGRRSASSDVPPGKRKNATIYSTLGKAIIDIDCEYEIRGDAYVYYQKALHNVGNHATVDIHNLLGAMGLPHTINATDRLTIGVFSGGSLAIEDD